MTSIDKLLSRCSNHGLQSDDEEEDIHPTISASEDEDDDLEADGRHSKLLQAIGSMDPKKKSKVKQRSEPSSEVSEFQLNTKDAQGKGVWIHDLLLSLRNTPSHSALKKQMNTINKRKRLPAPLHEHEAQKIQRKIAYQTVSKEVSKWDRVVEANRRAEHMSFPLNQEVVGLPTTDQFVKNFKPSTPLEQEVYKILRGSKFAERPNKKLTQAEEEVIKAMSLTEARERRAELQKHRALMSYFEAKSRRQKKIKSKKYHRIQKKSKVRQESKRVKELMKSDPEAAQESLSKLEKSRAEERMSLKHRNTGKWAKTMMRYGRHNISARQELAEQLKKSHELTEKIAEVNETDDADDKGEGEDDDDVGIKPSLSDINNPWFTGGKAKIGKADGEEEEVVEKEEGYVALEEVQASRDDDGADEEDEKEDEEDDELVEDHKILKMMKEERRRWNGDDGDEEEEDESENDVAIAAESKKRVNGRGKTKQDRTMSSKAKKRSKRKHIEVIEVEDGDKDDEDDGGEDAFLDEGLERRQTQETLEEQDWLNQLEEESGLVPASSSSETVVIVDDDPKDGQGGGETASSGNVDPKKVFTIKPKEVRSLAPQLVEDGDDEDAEKDRREHHMNIHQAFADDDVVGEFTEEKKARVEKDKPKDIDLTLPGWGAWGGMGAQPSKRRQKRFIIKAPPRAPRKDAKLQHVIINENRDKKIAMHQVSNLPFPFSSSEQFERSIRAPIGNTWNTPSAVKALTMPKISTKMGTIINPIEAEGTFKGKNRKPGKPEQKADKRKGPRPDIVFDDDEDEGSAKKKKKRRGKGKRK